MTTQEIIDGLTGWLTYEVCRNLQFKTAAEYEAASADGYDFQLSHPAVYAAFFPHDAAEHNGDNSASPIVAPAIIVSADGQSSFNRADGWVETPITLSLQVWNPGIHFVDENGVPGFRVGDEGWKDIAVMTDWVVKAIATAEFPGGLTLSGESINYTLPDVGENEFYPYYRSKIEFSVSHLRRLPSKFNI